MSHTSLLARQNGEHCGGFSFDTQAAELVTTNNTFLLASYKPVANSTENEPRYRSLQSCCSPNEVTKIEGDCLIWCEVPEQYLDDPDSFLDCFSDSVPDMPGNETSTGFASMMGGDNDEGRAALTQPSLYGVLLLTTMLAWFVMSA